jgi:N-carbamoylputrescine amidase
LLPVIDKKTADFLSFHRGAVVMTSIAVVQMRMAQDRRLNIDKAEAFIRSAAEKGADVVLLPELYEHPYFCKDVAHVSRVEWEWALPAAGHPTLQHMARLAEKLHVVLPLSFFEGEGDHFYNSLAVIDADGSILGIYRKSHIPSGPGYEEKSWFAPGDTGFKVWPSKAGMLGLGICWDQWFPEAARIMTLMGADILLYPTAIGSEPHAPDLDTAPHWRRVMQGHAGANIIPLAAANRVGYERGESCETSFYGSSFIAGPYGEIVAELNREEEGIAVAEFDWKKIQEMRKDWELLSDRRPNLYAKLLEKR